jgi:hypothetical protein
MRSAIARLPVAAVLCFALGSSAQANCVQELATYKDAAAASELAFTPRKEGEVDSMLARFTIMFPENNVVLDGIVMDAGEPFFRPLGMIMHNCPEGDATGDEIAACTVWQGIVYGVDEFGNVNYLASTNEGKEAAKTLLFPDLGAAVQMSTAFGAGKLSAPPKDDFKQSACLE